MRLCKYRDILGKPREGFHSVRIFDFALYDILATLVLAFVVSYLTNINYWKSLVVIMLIVIFLHWLFCVDTKLNVLLFGKTKIV